MSGGGGGSMPTWMVKAQAAGDAIMALCRRSPKSEFQDAQVLFAKFYGAAWSDWVNHSQLKNDLVEIILKHPDIFDRACAKRKKILEQEAAKKKHGHDYLNNYGTNDQGK